MGAFGNLGTLGYVALVPPARKNPINVKLRDLRLCWSPGAGEAKQVATRVDDDRGKPQESAGLRP